MHHSGSQVHIIHRSYLKQNTQGGKSNAKGERNGLSSPPLQGEYFPWEGKRLGLGGHYPTPGYGFDNSSTHLIISYNLHRTICFFIQKLKNNKFFSHFIANITVASITWLGRKSKIFQCYYEKVQYLNLAQCTLTEQSTKELIRNRKYLRLRNLAIQFQNNPKLRMA